MAFNDNVRWCTGGCLKRRVVLPPNYGELPVWGATMVVFGFEWCQHHSPCGCIAHEIF